MKALVTCCELPCCHSLTNYTVKCTIYSQNGRDLTTNLTHGFTLLKELNSQRRIGQFCDCVIQLHSHPGKLFLAHKSVLAAFSPVLDSLLPRHGTLMELDLPCLTPETLDNLNPQSQEESVRTEAFCLQMEQLQQTLKCREKATGEITVPGAVHKLTCGWQHCRCWI
ncbi:zinc finger and BTB domain-containing protein 43-like isoform X2 [Electrophorus electricus]|uniref:zinc finger and BTB domain-containing protein 43-like isoform X2 n=1 Tax=Electrophorus electricus TaxID=8005 RepID=UPI0015CF9B57|nr:zinc finger and BTB domain-containing protein 43-like isoform X2 [Electrophorus electricus]